MRSFPAIAALLLLLSVASYAQSGRTSPASSTIIGASRPGTVIMVEYYPTLADHFLDNRTRAGTIAGPDSSYHLTFELHAPSNCALYLDNMWLAAIEMLPGDTLRVGDLQVSELRTMSLEPGPSSRIATLYDQAAEDFKRHPAYMSEESEKRLLQISRIDSFLAAAAAVAATRDTFAVEWAAAHKLSSEEAGLLRSRFRLKPQYELRYLHDLRSRSGVIDSTALRVLDRLHAIVASPAAMTDADAWIVLADLFLDNYAAIARAPRPPLTGARRTPASIEQVSRILDGRAADAMMAKIVAAGISEGLTKVAGDHEFGPELRMDPELAPDGLLAALKRFGRDAGLYAATQAYVEHHRPLLPGNPAPELALTDAGGRTVHLSSFRGRPVLLAFWTTTGNVTPDVPQQLNGLRSRLGEDVVLVAVHLGHDEARWRSAIKESAEGIVHLYDSTEWWGPVGRRWALPQPGFTVAIDAEGRSAMRGFELHAPATVEVMEWLGR